MNNIYILFKVSYWQGSCVVLSHTQCMFPFLFVKVHFKFACRKYYIVKTIFTLDDEREGGKTMYVKSQLHMNTIHISDVWHQQKHKALWIVLLGNKSTCFPVSIIQTVCDSAEGTSGFKFVIFTKSVYLDTFPPAVYHHEPTPNIHIAVENKNTINHTFFCHILEITAFKNKASYCERNTNLLPFLNRFPASLLSVHLLAVIKS